VSAPVRHRRSRWRRTRTGDRRRAVLVEVPRRALRGTTDTSRSERPELGWRRGPCERKRTDAGP
jgi:hypothetical protein